MVPKLCNTHREYCTPISLVETLLHSKGAWHTHEKYDKPWHLPCITKCTKQWLQWTSLSKSLSASVRSTEVRWLNDMQFRRAVTERIALWSWRDWVWFVLYYWSRCNNLRELVRIIFLTCLLRYFAEYLYSRYWSTIHSFHNLLMVLCVTVWYSILMCLYSFHFSFFSLSPFLVHPLTHSPLLYSQVAEVKEAEAVDLDDYSGGVDPLVRKKKHMAIS